MARSQYRQPIYKKTVTRNRRWTQPDSTRLPANQGFVEIDERMFFLHLEVLLLGIYFVSEKTITEDELDQLTRTYHAGLMLMFPQETSTRPMRSVSF